MTDATVVRVSPNPKRTLPEEDATLIRDAMNAHEKSYAALREAVVTAHRKGAGVRALAEYTGMSTKTIVRWNAEVQ